MDHFTYIDGSLCAEEVPLARIAEAVGTPFYCYSSATLTRHYTVFDEAFDGLPHTVCFAIKANSNLAVIRTLAKLGAGADVVSIGEMRRAIAAHIPADKIVYSGVGKTEEDLREALKAGVMQINVESEPELEVLSAVAQSLNVNAPVAIRTNPHVDAKTHEKIATGKSENKFGIDWTRIRDVYAKAAKMPGIDLRGVAVHIGSQLTDLEPFGTAFDRMRGLVEDLRADGHEVSTLDLGGGLGISYDGSETPPPEDYAAVVKKSLSGLDVHLIFEPGRMIAGNAGVLVSKVVYVKQGETRNFVILDAAMNDLMRPSLYDASHDIVPLSKNSGADAPNEPVDVVGPVCETGDTFAKQVNLPHLKAEDMVAFRTAGAYGAVMASTYNTRPLVPEVMVNGNAFALVRPRMEVEDLIALDRIPEWMTKKGE